MLAGLFIVSSGVKVELPKYGLCYVDSSLLLHHATIGFTLKLRIEFTETFTCLFT